MCCGGDAAVTEGVGSFIAGESADGDPTDAV